MYTKGENANIEQADSINHEIERLKEIWDERKQACKGDALIVTELLPQCSSCRNGQHLCEIECE
jgi:hypothetical protein